LVEGKNGRGVNWKKSINKEREKKNQNRVKLVEGKT